MEPLATTPISALSCFLPPPPHVLFCFISHFSAQFLGIVPILHILAMCELRNERAHHNFLRMLNLQKSTRKGGISVLVCEK